MSDLVVTQSGSTPKQLPKISFFHKLIREIVALLFWIYLTLKLFVFDVDVYLVNHFSPEKIWILKYKFFLLTGVIATFWVFTKSRLILTWFLYITLYPLIFVFKKIPLFIFKQRSWILAFAIINSAISIFRSIKYNFIATTLFLLSALIIFTVHETLLLWVSIITIFSILCATYIRSVLFIFKPSALYEIYEKAISGLFDAGKPSYSLEQGIKGLPIIQLSDKQLEKWVSGLQFAILYNRVCYFMSKKLRDYQNSKFNFMSYIVNLLFIVLATIITFTVINYGLYKIHNDFFAVTNANVFSFFYYSFSAFTFGSIPEISAITWVSQLSQIIEKFFALFVGLIFASHVISMRSERYSNEIGDVITTIKKRGDEMQIFIQDEYKLTFEEAMKEVERLKGNMLSFIYKLSKNIE